MKENIIKPERQQIMKKDFTEFLPELVVAESDDYQIILNKKGELELVSACGEIKNLGKMKKKGAH